MRDLMKVWERPKFIYAIGLTSEITPARADSRFGVAFARDMGGWAVSIWGFWAVKLPRTQRMEDQLKASAEMRAGKGGELAVMLTDKLDDDPDGLFEHMN